MGLNISANNYVIGSRKVYAMFGCMVVSAYRYIATATLAIIAVFVEYLGQFLNDLN